MADTTVTTGAAQGDAAAAGGNGSTQTTAAAGAGTGDAGGQATTPNTQAQGQDAGGAMLGNAAFADKGGESQNGTPGGEGNKDGKTDQETKPEAVIPETAEAYAFEAPKDIPVNDAMLGKVKDIALAGKLSQDQFAAIMPELLKLDAGRFDAMKQAYAQQRAAGVQALQQEWGQEFGANVSLANKAVAAFGSPELGALFDATGIGDHPLVVKTFAAIGKALSEDQAFGRAAGANQGPARDVTGNPQLSFSDMGRG